MVAIDIVVINEIISGSAVFETLGTNCPTTFDNKPIASTGKTPIITMTNTKLIIGKRRNDSFSEGIECNSDRGVPRKQIPYTLVKHKRDIAPISAKPDIPTKAAIFMGRALIEKLFAMPRKIASGSSWF